MHIALASAIAGGAGLVMSLSAIVLRAERRSARLRDRISQYTN